MFLMSAAASMNNQSAEFISQLALTQISDVGIAHIKKMLTHFQTAENICRAKKSELQQWRLNENQINIIHNPNKKWIEIVLRWQEKNNHHIIFYTDARYPELLAEISSAPPIIYVKGDAEILSQPQIALVGSRNPSHTCLELSAEFAFQLSQAGLIITSGLAMGVDAASHQGALNAGGKTIAVLGSGLEKIYPKRNIKLAEKIIENGCLVSEFPIDAEPIAYNFPRRNRIISGLSLGTLVIEAALKSGSLITAKFAVEQNRDVFAIPGSIRNPLSTGCLALIQQGAKCVTNIDDILSEIDSRKITGCTKQSLQQQLTLDCEDNPVLACIDNDVTTIDQICDRSKLSAQVVSTILLELELKNVVKRQFGGFVRA